MFFAQDVLYSDGPLSLMWMAGNNEFKGKDFKSRRNKTYLLLLNSNIIELAAQVRKYFPAMGSAHGLSLRKVSILIKGLSIIYQKQMQHLAWSMHTIHLRMSISAKQLRQIDLPVETPSRTTHRSVVPQPVETFGFGDFDETLGADLLVDEFRPRCFTSNAVLPEVVVRPAITETPNSDERGTSSRKRKRHVQQTEEGFDESQVLNLLEEAISRNPMAHCLLEDDANQPQREFEGFDQFGDMGMGFGDYLNENMESRAGRTTENDGPAISVENPMLLSPGDRVTTRNLDDGEGRHGRSRKRPASVSEAGDIEQEIGQQQNVESVLGTQSTVMSTEGEQLDLQSLQVVDRRRGRRRYPLQIDQETLITLQYMHMQLQAQKRPLDYDELEEMRQSDRNGLVEKKNKKIALDVLLESAIGRQTNVGSALKQFIGQAHATALLPVPIRDRLPEELGGNLIASRNVREEGTLPGGVSTFGIQGGQIASDIGMDMQNEVESEQDNQSEMGRQIMNDVQQGEMEYQAPEFDIPEIILHPPEVHPEELGVAGLGDETVTFKKLFPPGKISKKQAATGFYQLLRMKAMHKVELKQDEPYGDIFVSKSA